MRMIEKVARALFACEGMAYADDERMFEPYPFEEIDEIELAGFMDRARAAIEAMREPDDEMAKAGIAAWEKSPMAVVTQFRAMIDKALESGE